MSVLHLDLQFDDAESDYIAGALCEREQDLHEFAREALLEWAAR